MCSGGDVDHGEVPLIATAWIDVNNDNATSCIDIRASACQPSSRDPSATKGTALRFHELTTVTLEVTDPP